MTSNSARVALPSASDAQLERVLTACCELDEPELGNEIQNLLADGCLRSTTLLLSGESSGSAQAVYVVLSSDALEFGAHAFLFAEGEEPEYDVIDVKDLPQLLALAERGDDQAEPDL